MDRNTKESKMASPKVLTIYFSHSGNTKKIAEHIHKQMGGDIVEIRAADPYPNDYNAVVEQAKQEWKSGYRPALKTKVKNIDSYDVIFVGSPNWCNTVAPPVKTFLTEYDLSGKSVAPFITHAGSGMGRSVTDIAKLCPESNILDGLAVWGDSAKTAQNEVSEWLLELGMENQSLTP